MCGPQLNSIVQFGSHQKCEPNGSGLRVVRWFRVHCTLYIDVNVYIHFEIVFYMFPSSSPSSFLSFFYWFLFPLLVSNFFFVISVGNMNAYYCMHWF